MLRCNEWQVTERSEMRAKSDWTLLLLAGGPFSLSAPSTPFTTVLPRLEILSMFF
jgi:hypothetical protein